jgi:hypothetical protein
MDDWPKKWVWKLEDVSEEPAPSARKSFAALDSASRAPERAVKVGAVSECPLPFLELRVRDAEGKPISGALCKLSFPAGGGRQGQTDSTGLAHFSNVEADPDTLMVRVYENVPVPDAAPTYRVEVVPREDEAESPKKSEPSPSLEPLYYVELDVRDT